jgi:hypothetical protein
MIIGTPDHGAVDGEITDDVKVHITGLSPADKRDGLKPSGT